MESETSFRIVLLVILVVTMSIAIYHRLRAAASRERISHEEEGCLFAIVLRLAGLLMWIAIFAYLVCPSAIAWASMALPAWLRWSGVVGGALCPLLLYWTLSSLGKNLTDTVVTRSTATLVTHGPYRYVRHPFYVTAALLLVAITLLTANWLIVVSSLLALVMLAVRTPKEEQMLVARFGDDYRRYMSRTGRFFPIIGRKEK
jgi:protein-S-isoprenylcysteine O-methyltransferase Ste14